MKREIFLGIIIAAAFMGFFYLPAADIGENNLALVASTKAKPPALAEIKKCLNKTEKTGECMDGLFGNYFKRGGTTSGALLAARQYEEIDSDFKYTCHPVMHAIGRETFRLHSSISDSFRLCDQTCHSGCYHGAMERFLRGDFASNDEVGHINEEEIAKKTLSACDPNQPARFRFQCLHGLGHAVMFFLDYELEKSLANCDILGDSWSRSSCYGGVFMENVFSATPEKRDLNQKDFHYPCSKLDKKHKSDCYVMQTTRMTEMGLSVSQIFDECKKAKEFRPQCMQSEGRDLSNNARVKHPRFTSATCELVQGEDRRFCTRGVIYALIDNTWDGKYALPFCESFADKRDAEFCISASLDYMRSVYIKNSADIQAECSKYLKDASVCNKLALGR